MYNVKKNSHLSQLQCLMLHTSNKYVMKPLILRGFMSVYVQILSTYVQSITDNLKPVTCRYRLIPIHSA